jgi:hypothetical protein
MNQPDRPQFDLIVAGDVVVDHHIYEGERSLPTTDQRGVRDWRELGGAPSLYRLVAEIFAAAEKQAADEKAAKEKVEKKKAKKDKAAGNAPAAAAAEKPAEEPAWRVHLGVTTPSVNAALSDFHAFAAWHPFPLKIETRNDDKRKAWRASSLMGYGEIAAPVRNGRKYDPKPVAGLPRPRILLLDDGGYRFRSVRTRDCWLLPEGDQPPDLILLKMSSPIAQGDLWYELIDRFSGRLVCLVSADELRQECVSISSGLSWERTVEETLDLLVKNPVLAGLNRCTHLIVRFKTDGALWVDRSDPANPAATLIYDGGGAEGGWEDRCEGKVVGYSSVMVAALGYALARHVSVNAKDQDKGRTGVPGIAAAIEAGLVAMRDLQELGHGLVGDSLPSGFPAARLAQAILEPGSSFARAVILWPRQGDPPHATGGNWMIVETSQRALGAAARPSLAGLARQVVLQGYSAIKRLPHARFGELTTADRAEIETLRNLRRLMVDYRGLKKVKKPLSLGIFGPPGAGKSFGVRQLADAVFEGEWLEFNLSQFAGPADLVGAFHQVRDRVLSGKTPVVFWDEFDSKDYDWLQYLLAPMQDGRFQEGQLNHAIGKCVFVFAGGTSPRFEEFGPPDRPNPSPDAKQALRDFQLRKGPDFKSRLDAYYDVAGPNQRTLPRTENPSGGEPEPDPSDVCAPLRRALMIRGVLGCKPDERLDIDSDLLDALLLVPKYKHGSRSLEKLVKPLQSATGGPIRRSSLPAAPQLAMHVDAKAFAAILNRNEAFKMSGMIEPVAEGIHQTWRALAKKEGWKMQPQFDKPYARLAEIDKEDNRAAARRIPEILALAGMGVADKKQPGSSDEPSEEIINAHLQHHLERLAEAEHDGWVEQRLKNGWRYGEPRDDERKIHPLLVPYASLHEKEKKKDRNSVGHFPDMVAMAGYRIVWLKG